MAGNGFPYPKDNRQKEREEEARKKLQQEIENGTAKKIQQPSLKPSGTPTKSRDEIEKAFNEKSGMIVVDNRSSDAPKRGNPFEAREKSQPQGMRMEDISNFTQKKLPNGKTVAQDKADRTAKETAERKAAAEKAAQTAQERGKNQTNRIIQEREYQQIAAKQQAKKAANAANEKGKKQTADVKANNKTVKDKGQDRNLDKAGWKNPNGPKKPDSEKNTPSNKNTKKEKKTDPGKAYSGEQRNGKKIKDKKSNTKKSNAKESNTKEKLKKAWNAADAMRERREKAMKGKKAFNANDAMRQRREAAMKGRTAFNAEAAMKARREAAMKNRDQKKNPNNVNLRGIVRNGRKG